MNARFTRLLHLILLVLLCLTAIATRAQEPPYFVTYSHVLEEPGNLEVASQNVGSTPKNANPFYSQTMELEYGIAGRSFFTSMANSLRAKTLWWAR